MTAANLDVLRLAQAAINADDVGALIEVTDPRGEMDTTGGAGISGAVYCGHEGVRAWQRDLHQAWTDFRVEPELYRQRGDQVLVCYRIRGRGRYSGAEAARQIAALVTVRDGLIVRFKTYDDRETALRETGLTEDTLAPWPA